MSTVWIRLFVVVSECSNLGHYELLHVSLTAVSMETLKFAVGNEA